MKNKQMIISCIISSAITLTGCNTNNNIDFSNENAQITTINETFVNELESTPTENESSIETTINERAEIINKIDIEGILLPDDSRVPKETAKEIIVGDFNSIAIFDYSFIRYAKPVYVDSNMAEIYDSKHGCFYIGDFDDIVYPEYEKVKVGDVLKNGLKVKSAKMSLRYLEEPDGLVTSTISLEGDITWEGFLYCKFEDDFHYEPGDLYFIPSPVLNDFIPINAVDGSRPKIIGLHDEKSGFSFVQDSFRINLGNISELDADISKYFEKQEFVKAKITLTDIVLRFFYDGGGEKSYATVKDIEIMN